MFPLGLVTMLFLVLFVWGCAGKERKKAGDTTRVLTTASVSMHVCSCAFICTELFNLMLMRWELFELNFLHFKSQTFDVSPFWKLAP